MGFFEDVPYYLTIEVDPETYKVLKFLSQADGYQEVEHYLEKVIKDCVKQFDEEVEQSGKY